MYVIAMDRTSFAISRYLFGTHPHTHLLRAQSALTMHSGRSLYAYISSVNKNKVNHCDGDTQDAIILHAGDPMLHGLVFMEEMRCMSQTALVSVAYVWRTVYRSNQLSYLSC